MISCRNEEVFRSLLIMTINWFFLTRQFLYIWSSPVRISGQFGGSLRISPPALASIEINMQQASMPSSYVHATCQIGRSRKSRWHKYKSTNELITGKENNYKANVHLGTVRGRGRGRRYCRRRCRLPREIRNSEYCNNWFRHMHMMYQRYSFKSIQLLCVIV